jgi:hypothetical protein
MPFSAGAFQGEFGMALFYRTYLPQISVGATIAMHFRILLAANVCVPSVSLSLTEDCFSADVESQQQQSPMEEAHNVPRKTEAMPAAAPGPRYRDGKWFKFRGGGGRRKPLGKVHRRG